MTATMKRFARAKWPRLAAAFCFGFLWISTAPPVLADEESDAEQPLFLPLPPDIPRFQFLAKFSSPQDISTTKKGFRDFVFGGEDREAQLVEKPYGLAVHEGAIYVVDTRGNGYGVFDLAAGRSRIVQPSGAGALKKPINISIDVDGTRYITDTEREQILVFNSDDRFVRAIGKPGQFRPVDIAIDGNRLYVTDIMHHQVHVLDKVSGEVLLSFGEAGSDPGKLFHPTNLAVGEDGTVYVTDTTNFRIQQFDADGNLIRVIGAQGTSYGSFARPKGVALDLDGNIYVVDAAFQNVQVLAPDGAPLMAFGGPDAGRVGINLPTVVKIDYDNIEYFRKYAAPNFEVKYLVFVASQYGLNKVIVLAHGELRE